MAKQPAPDEKQPLRSQLWFSQPGDPGMTSLYVERYMNWGLSREELQSGRPLIGIAQSGRREANLLISAEELTSRRARLGERPDYVPESQTPWQEIQRSMVDQFDQGMVLKPAVKYRDIAARFIPRDNH